MKKEILLVILSGISMVPPINIVIIGISGYFVGSRMGYSTQEKKSIQPLSIKKYLLIFTLTTLLMANVIYGGSISPYMDKAFWSIATVVAALFFWVPIFLVTFKLGKRQVDKDGHLASS